MSKLNKLYFFKRPGIFDPGNYGFGLPAAYQKFWREWKTEKPEPVHYIPEKGKWKRNPNTGEVLPIQNVPIPLKFPKESHEHLWGGEGVVQGFQKRDPRRRRVPYYWVPVLHRSVVYSEILDKYMSVILTDRTLNLIHKNYGLDHYILKTRACDLQSKLAVKLKRKMLLALQSRDLAHNDLEKKEEVYNKYKGYLDNYTTEDIEWYGLTLSEAVHKMNVEKEETNKPQPLKIQYRQNLIQELLEKEMMKAAEKSAALLEDNASKKSWLSKINPFGGKE